jgi:hypothetical protein
MTVPVMTVRVISHFWLPYLSSTAPLFQLGSGLAADVHGWDNGKAGPERMGWIKFGIQDYLYGNALYYLDKVSRCVLRGEETENGTCTRL